MEINDVTKERLAEKVLAEMSKARLLNKDVAAKFDGSPSDMSNLKKKDNHGKISSRIWNNIHTWYYSGITLESFKLSPAAEPAPGEVAEKVGQQAEQYMREREEASAPAMTTAKAQAKSDPEPTQEESAAYKKEARAATHALREEHESREQAEEIPEEPELKEVVIPELSVEKPAHLNSLIKGIASLFKKKSAQKPEKQEMAERMREEFERSRGKLTIPREEINPKTGTRITVEILDDYFTITIPRR